MVNQLNYKTTPDYLKRMKQLLTIILLTMLVFSSVITASGTYTCLGTKTLTNLTKNTNKKINNLNKSLENLPKQIAKMTLSIEKMDKQIANIQKQIDNVLKQEQKWMPESD